MRNLIFTSILLVLISGQRVFSQHEFGVKFAGGISYMIEGIDCYKPGLSSSSGLTYSTSISDRFKLASQLTWTYVSGNSKENYSYDPNARYFTYVDLAIAGRNFSERADYFNFSVLFGYKMNKWTIYLGPQTSLQNYQWTETTTRHSDGRPDKVVETTQRGMAKNGTYQYGFQFIVSHRLTNNLYLDLDVSGTYHKNLPHPGSVYDNCLLGVHYNLIGAKNN